MAMENKRIKLAYVNTLSSDAKIRYLKKISLVENVDPYCIEKVKWKTDEALWAAVQHPDIVNFLVLTTSFNTCEALKAYKNLDTYNQALNGWVKQVKVCIINGLCVHTSEVSVTLCTVHRSKHCTYFCLHKSLD